MSSAFKILIASSLLAIVALLGFIAYEYHQSHVAQAEMAAMEQENRAKAERALEAETKRLRDETETRRQKDEAEAKARQAETERRQQQEGSWPSRAGEHVTGIMKTESGVADMFLKASHPSGHNPQIKRATHVESGDTTTIYFDLDFNGGWSGRAYTTKMKFSFARGIYKGFELISDNAAFPIDAPHLRQLDDVCRSICDTMSTQIQ